MSSEAKAKEDPTPYTTPRELRMVFAARASSKRTKNILRSLGEGGLPLGTLRRPIPFPHAFPTEGNMYYVYLIQSETHPGKRYTGFTRDLKKRLAAHNAG